jgi:hypothetical protein
MFRVNQLGDRVKVNHYFLPTVGFWEQSKHLLNNNQA